MTARIPYPGRALAIAAILLGCSGACSRPAPSPEQRPRLEARGRERPNIVLVVLCSFRANRIGAAEDYPRKLTPFLDSVIAGGTYFDQAVSAASWTKPATASLLSGLAPNVHGLTDYYKAADIRAGLVDPRRSMPEGIVTLAELLAAAGYQTASRVNNIHAGEFFDVTQGFASRQTTTRRRTSELIDSFAEWLGRIDRERPFFFFLFTLEAHSPYRPRYEHYLRTSRRREAIPAHEFERFRQSVHDDVMARLRDGRGWPEELRRDWIDLYDAGIVGVDAGLGRLAEVLQNAGVADRTILVITADHGERFFEHGRVDHGWFPDEPVLRIPIVLAGPGIPRNRLVPRIVRSIDIYPTIADLAGVAVPSVVQGQSLLPLVRTGLKEARRSAFAMGGGDQDFALRAGRFKLRLDLKGGGRARLYDVEIDPLEESDIAADHPAVFRSMLHELRGWIRQAEGLRSRVGSPRPIELTPEAFEALQRLGYIDG